MATPEDDLARRSSGLMWAAAAVLGTVLAFALTWALFAVYARNFPTVAASWWTTMAQETAEGIGVSLVGLLVLHRLPGRALGWMLIALGAGDAGKVLALAVALSPVGPALTADLWLLRVVAIIGLQIARPALALFFPDGRPTTPRWRALVIALGVTSAMGVLSRLVSLPNAGPKAPNPFYVKEIAAFFEGVGATGFILHQIVWALCIWTLVPRWRRSDGLARHQIAIMLPVFALYFIGTTAQTIIGVYLEQLDPGVLTAALYGVLNPLWAVLALLHPAALAYVVTRTRLYQLDLALRSALTVVAIAGAIGLTYLIGAGLLAASLSGAWSAGSLAVGALTGLVGAGLWPMVQWARQRAERRFYGHRAEPYLAMRALTLRLAESLDPAGVPQAVCQSLVTALRLPAAAIEVDLPAGPARVASVGSAAGDPAVFPLWHSGNTLGRLLVWPRQGQHSLDAADLAALRPLADQTATALAASRLHEQLSVDREAERRRLRQDLHDTLGPTLAGVRLQLEAARGLLPAHSPAVSLLVSSTTQLRKAIEDMRGLTRDVRPIVLDEHGLVEALRALAHQLSTADTPVLAELPEQDPPLSGAAEVAVYRIAAEALANAVRHAEASRIDLRLVVSADAVGLTVRDDGRGFAAGTHGIGLESMRERAHRLGGRCQITNSSSGTLVELELPRIGHELN